jgi:hypothetical protein
LRYYINNYHKRKQDFGSKTMHLTAEKLKLRKLFLAQYTGKTESDHRHYHAPGQ